LEEPDDAIADVQERGGDVQEKSGDARQRARRR